MSSFTVESFAGHMDTLLDLLRDLVERESPSTDKQALDKLGSFLAERMESLEAKVDRFPQDNMGDHWLGTWGNGPGGVLLLAHIDTVYPLGILSSMPWSRDEDFVYGPGCLDMKVSLAMALTVIEHLRAEQKLRPDRISLLCTSDEEIGSQSSRSLIERLAKEHDLVLCLEPALPDGSLKTWRKGILNFEIEARGQAAHAGSDINAGTNAIIEISHQIPEILGLADPSSATTVNIGVIQGGSRSNVVPDCCSVKIDVRAKTWEEGERVLHAIKQLRPVLNGANLDIHGGWNRPPMEYDDHMQETFQRATAIASTIDINLSQGGTGGGSDANFVARLGVPVLDGLGAIGAGAHSPNERVAINSLPTRCALLAALVSDW
jgi:glutamate carboxypeptidase